MYAHAEHASHSPHGLQVTPTTHHYWRDIEVREEGGTPQIIGSIRAGLVMQLKEAVGPEQIEAIELACARKVLDRWSKIPEVSLSSICLSVCLSLFYLSVCLFVCLSLLFLLKS